MLPLAFIYRLRQSVIDLAQSLNLRDCDERQRRPSNAAVVFRSRLFSENFRRQGPLLLQVTSRGGPVIDTPHTRRVCPSPNWAAHQRHGFRRPNKRNAAQDRTAAYRHGDHKSRSVRSLIERLSNQNKQPATAISGAAYQASRSVSLPITSHRDDEHRNPAHQSYC